ncbi:hypothetical protein GGTG_05902 [Gaeumannomyces tritici R3-111a-1]|uniref:Uncharacterized protein n=1 Tax=Gaeumannomyces tritici (strain R3-111a-1) TaxID=644352 RepID=J3NX95_GAET3|nr:hypothetical protein GGTG_05902 [Gaeumannomyces tritici R3-111a-1]EJT75977.1 hypothetical protein GGTG_05902 [Gaeumannomyces tritici R3-111a-1]
MLTETEIGSQCQADCSDGWTRADGAAPSMLGKGSRSSAAYLAKGLAGLPHRAARLDAQGWPGPIAGSTAGLDY